VPACHVQESFPKIVYRIPEIEGVRKCLSPAY